MMLIFFHIASDRPLDITSNTVFNLTTILITRREILC